MLNLFQFEHSVLCFNLCTNRFLYEPFKAIEGNIIQLKIMNHHLTLPYYLLILLCFACYLSFGKQTEGFFEEKDGFIVVEAEDYHSQELDQIRKWYRVYSQFPASVSPDIDGSHIATASKGMYLEILPDTRTNHDEKLIPGENFTNEPGKIAILNYKVKFNTPGKYYVWVRAYSTGSEDNGIHVGLDGNWVDSGQRMQWCEGKNKWTWASKQRTKEIHCGVKRLIYLTIETAGIHTISFSMREDGFEFDQWAMSQVYEVPELINKQHRACQQWEVNDFTFKPQGKVANPLAVKFGMVFTHESGRIFDIPSFYNGDTSWVVRFTPALTGTWQGKTYSTLSNLTERSVEMTVGPNMKKDQGIEAPFATAKKDPYQLSAIRDYSELSVAGFVKPYIDKNRKAIAINAVKFKNEYAAVNYPFHGESGTYNLELRTLAELDGESKYRIAINGQLLEGTKTNPRIFGTGIADYAPAIHVWKTVKLEKGDVIRVECSSETNGKIPEGDITAYSRGRFTGIKLIVVE